MVRKTGLGLRGGQQAVVWAGPQQQANFAHLALEINDVSLIPGGNFLWEMLYPPLPRGSVQRAASVSLFPLAPRLRGDLGSRWQIPAGISGVGASTESF